MFKNLFLCAAFIMPVIAGANGQDFEEDNNKILHIDTEDDKFAVNQEEGKDAGALVFLVDEEEKQKPIFNSEDEEKALVSLLKDEEDLELDDAEKVLISLQNDEEHLELDDEPKLFYSFNESEKDEGQSILASANDQEDKVVNLFNEEEKSTSLI